MYFFIFTRKNKINKMGPAKKKNEGGGNWRADDEKDKLQAVVIADSFNRKFTPITQDMPRVKYHFKIVVHNFH